jgi:hypothetical protein
MTWLDRTLVCGPYLALCTSEAEYRKAMGHLKIKLEDTTSWVNPGFGAKTHVATHPNGGLATIVCIKPVRLGKKYSREQVHALLAHEAVHVFDEFCDHIGERKPSSEFAAYSVQAIAQQLMVAYRRATRG